MAPTGPFHLPLQCSVFLKSGFCFPGQTRGEVWDCCNIRALKQLPMETSNCVAQIPHDYILLISVSVEAEMGLNSQCPDTIWTSRSKKFFLSMNKLLKTIFARMWILSGASRIYILVKNVSDKIQLCSLDSKAFGNMLWKPFFKWSVKILFMKFGWYQATLKRR